MSRLPWVLLLAAVLAVAACAGPASSPHTSPAPSVAAPESPAARVPAPSSDPTPGSAATEPTASPAAPAWQSAELRDVRSGETFTIASLAGNLVVIEPMAIWCSNCRAQQNAAREALKSIDNPAIVYISLDIDPNENEPDLASYADANDFPWRFAVASREVARALAEQFGDGVLSPPSVPTITILPNGTVELHFGHRDSAQLEADLTARLP